MAFSIPTLAAVLSFVTYGATKDNLDPVRLIPRCRILETSLTTAGRHLHLARVVQPSPTAFDVPSKGTLDLD